MNIKKMLFTNTPANFKKDFINNFVFINYTRTKIFSFFLIFISGLMYIISILEKDAIFIIHANLVFFILSIIVAILFNIKKIYNKNDIKNYHKIIISLLIIIVLSWSTALITFNPDRYELIGTYAIVILSISSFIFLKWQMNLFILGSSFFIVFYYFIIKPKQHFLPSITVLVFLLLISWIISRLLYYTYMQNYVAQKKLKLQNNEIQKEIFLKSEQIREYENKIIKEIIYSINKLLEIHDPYTKGHSQHVADIARKISIKMNLSEKEIKIAYWSGLLHDIGKLLIPLEILNKKSSLSNKEYELVKKHPYNGYQVLNGSKSLTEIAKNVLYHHERWDGKGYPEGIKGENIPLISQIITVADAWDAMRSSRAYRAPLSKRKAIKEIKKNKGKQFSPEIVDIFLLILRNTEKCQEEY